MPFKGKATAEDKIRALECYPEVHDKLVTGWSVGDIARFIHEDSKELATLSRKQLESALQRFRNNMSPAEKAGKLLPKVVQDAAKELEQGLDEVREFQRLYEMQMARIAIDQGNEKNIGKLFPTLNQEMRVAAEILNASAKLKQSLGVTQRAPHSVSVDINATMTSTHTDVVKIDVINDAEKRSKLLSLANRLLNLPQRVEDVGGDSSIIDVEFEEVEAPTDGVEA